MAIIQQTGTHHNHKSRSVNNLQFCRVVPFVLLTNGGGVSEAEKARQISEIVGVKVRIYCSFSQIHSQVLL